MLSKSSIKYIQSLKQKKYRTKYKAFVVEGEKMVKEAIDSPFAVEFLITTDKSSTVEKAVLIDEPTMKKLTSFSTASSWLAVVKMKEDGASELTGSDLAIVLDGVKDPGNLGTILRIADWYGIDTVICSKETVDVFNPKTVQSTMGALYRMNVEYRDLLEYLPSYKAQFPNNPIYGALMDGDNLYQKDKKGKGIIVMGSESHGISKEVEDLLTDRITIPGEGRSESLNVAIATGIICSEFMREKFN